MVSGKLPTHSNGEIPAMTNITHSPRPQLPQSMSKLLEIAIADARSLDRSLYRPFSREWHTKLPDGPCLICLAGSVIAGTFKASINSKRFPWSYDTEAG